MAQAIFQLSADHSVFLQCRIIMNARSLVRIITEMNALLLRLCRGAPPSLKRL
jgi:hypothetical protein